MGLCHVAVQDTGSGWDLEVGFGCYGWNRLLAWLSTGGVIGVLCGQVDRTTTRQSVGSIPERQGEL